MNHLSTLLSRIVYAPMALVAAPIAIVLWLVSPTDRRLELPQEQWALGQVACAQGSLVG